MTGSELKTFLEELDWDELQNEVVFCRSSRGIKEGSFTGLSDVSGSAVTKSSIVLLSSAAAGALQEEFGTDEVGMDGEEEPEW